LNLPLSASSNTACVFTNVVLTGTANGGTPANTGPAYTYSWTQGPAT
jgi:hypothetical protein